MMSMYLPVHPRPTLNLSMTSMYMPVHPRPTLNTSQCQCGESLTACHPLPKYPAGRPARWQD
jgi:hypothetical protein